jgi:hypothetical protein
MNILTVNTQIIAIDPIEKEDTLEASGISYPKNAILGYEIHNVQLPSDFILEKYMWNGAEVTKIVPPLSLADQLAFIAQVDADVDKLYDQAVGNRGPEYLDALNDALAFKATGYTTPVPQSVTDWSVISGLSLQAATDNVIAAAGALKAAQTAIRKQRLACKQAARVATTQDALDAVKAQWATFINAVKTQLGLK